MKRLYATADQVQRLDPLMDHAAVHVPVRDPYKARSVEIFSEPTTRAFLPVKQSTLQLLYAGCEVISGIGEGFTPTGTNERVGQFIDYDSLLFCYRMSVPSASAPFAAGSQLQVGIFWDRTFPPSSSAPSVGRYWSGAHTYGGWMPNPDTEHECVLLWTTTFTEQVPTYNALVYPDYVPPQATYAAGQIELDLRGLRAQYLNTTSAISAMGGGQLVVTWLCTPTVGELDPVPSLDASYQLRYKSHLARF